MTFNFRQHFEDLTFMSPLSELRAERLVRFLAEGLDGTVVDIGCGWAELLLRTVEAAPQSRGIGVDLNVPSIDHGRELAAHRGLEDRVTLLAADARTTAPARADAVICIGASQVWGPPVEAAQPLDYASALHAIRAMVSPGDRVVYGEAIWSRPPAPEAVAPLSGRLDEFVSLDELVELAVDSALMPVAVHEASIDEWDVFESGFSACYAHWLVEHGTDHPDAQDVRARAAEQRRGYLNGYRGTMGMAYLALVAV